MVHPDKVGIEAKKKEDENFKFRSFLKGHADEEELEVVIDFEGVQWMGQGFAHQLFVVFAREHSDIQIVPINMNEDITKMYNHVITS